MNRLTFVVQGLNRAQSVVIPTDMSAISKSLQAPSRALQLRLLTMSVLVCLTPLGAQAQLVGEPLEPMHQVVDSLAGVPHVLVQVLVHEREGHGVAQGARAAEGGLDHQ